MNRPSDIDAGLAAWVEQGPSGGPDRVLTQALAQALSTHQDRGWLDRLTHPLRYQPMHATLKIAAVAVLALAVAIVVDPLRPSSQSGAPDPSPSAAPSPSPAPVRLTGADGSLAAGTYYDVLGAGKWTVTVPDGWEDFYGILWSDLGVPGTNEDVGGPGEVALGWEDPVNVFTDPCHWKDSLADPPVGPSVDDLATAFVAGAGRDVSGPTDVVFGGYPAKMIELSMPADLDVATCDQGVYRVFLGAGEALAIPEESGAPDLGRLFTVLYILDIDGTRKVMQAWHRADSSEEDLAELEAMLASIRIDPPVPSLSPPPSQSPVSSASPAPGPS